MPGTHVPVLLREVVAFLQPQSGQHFIDGTVGGGGHAKAILEATTPDGHLLAMDRDAEALWTIGDSCAWPAVRSTKPSTGSAARISAD